MRDLPFTWAEVILADLVSQGQYGWTTKASSRGTIKYLRTTDITKGKIDWETVPYCLDVPLEVAKYQVRPGDILISRAGSVGHSILIGDIPIKTVFASYLIRFVPHKEVDAKYLAYFLKSSSYWQQISEASAGIALANVNAKKLATIKIPLAPFIEQKRIADKLDILLARVDTCRTRLNRISLIIRRFRQAVLNAATLGHLTKDWREGEDQNWSRISIAKISESSFDGPFGSNLKSEDYTETGVRVVRLENIGHLKFIREKESYISYEKYLSLKKNTLKPNDVLFSSFIDEEIRVSLFPMEVGLAINKADCFCIRTNSKLCLPQFLALRLAHQSTYRQLRELVHGATRPRINLGQLKQFEFDLPSLAEQYEIVRRVEALFTYLDGIEAHCHTAYCQIDQLMPSLLSKAFRGELVPQDPNDEPASILLERIKVARQSILQLTREPSTSNKKKRKRDVIDLLSILESANNWLNAQDAFRECGVGDGAETDMIEKLFFELRELLKKGRIEVERRGEEDWLRIRPTGKS